MGVRGRRSERAREGDDSSCVGQINRSPLIARLSVLPVDGDGACFEGRPIDGFDQRVFGGHLVGQAVLSAAATVGDHRAVCSLHAYFLRTGVAGRGLRYRVIAVRDGRSLSVRAVSVTQDGRELATVQLIFATPAVDEDQAVHVPAPRVPDPDGLPSLDERRRLGLPADGIKLPTRADWRTASRPLDIRYVDDHVLSAESTGARCFWFRADDPGTADQNAHRAILAFASDRSLLPVIAKARGELGDPTEWPVTSVDHALWFHADVRAPQWLLYVQDSPYSGAHSGFARGTIFDADRRPVASVAQHGLLLRPLQARRS